MNEGPRLLPRLLQIGRWAFRVRSDAGSELAGGVADVAYHPRTSVPHTAGPSVEAIADDEDDEERDGEIGCAQMIYLGETREPKREGERGNRPYTLRACEKLPIELMNWRCSGLSLAYRALEDISIKALQHSPFSLLPPSCPLVLYPVDRR